MYQKKIKPLTLIEALTLYEVLGKYLPDINFETKELDVEDYSKTIYYNIVADEKPKVFADALEIMAKKSLKDLLSMDDVERWLLFIECVGINQLWRLNGSLKDIGYGISR